MRFVVAVCAAFLAAGCKPTPIATSGTTKAAGGNPPSGVAAMPDFPAASPGVMHLASAAPGTLTSAAPAKAGLCEQPAVLLVQSNQAGVGALLVLALPAAAARVGRYPVSYSMTGPAKLPAAPAAQLAIQQVTQQGVLGFQALEGNVELYGLGAKVSGRFQVTLREINSERLERVAGTFSEVPVEVQPRAYCERFAESAAPQGGAAH